MLQLAKLLFPQFYKNLTYAKRKPPFKNLVKVDELQTILV